MTVEAGAAVEAGAREVVHLRIITPESVLFDGEADWVDIPLHDGRIGIWPGHAPLIGAISAGTVRFSWAGGVREIEVAGGILRVDVERCSVLIGSLFLSADAQTKADQDQLAYHLEDALHDTLTDQEIEELQREP